MKAISNINKIKFKAFRAIEDKEACERYYDGHQKVLKVFNIAHITSALPVWMENPNCYLIIAESISEDIVYGGARVQIADSINILPIEEAVSEIDPKVHDLVRTKALKGTGELCGLWNSREVAGLGIGSIFLGRTSISLTTQLNLTSLFALCAPATLRNCIRLGFEIERSLGNNGAFYYPKLDLIATALLMNDPTQLTTATLLERTSIHYLREFPKHTKMEDVPNGSIEIEYNLSLQKQMSKRGL